MGRKLWYNAIHLFFIPTFLLFQNHLAHCSSTLNHRKYNVKECPSNCKGPGKDCPVYEPDFVKWAESYGAKGIRVTNTEEMNAAFEEAKKNKKTSTVIEFMIATHAKIKII